MTVSLEAADIPEEINDSGLLIYEMLRKLSEEERGVLVYKFWHRYSLSEMAKLFQAIRMEVNHETDALREMLLSAMDILKPGGRLSVITYHSIEDRMVKNLIKCGNIEGTLEKDFYGHVQKPLHAVNNKVIIPDEKEIEINPRSRSAKLRIAEKD